MTTNSIAALKGIAITPPVIGRISLGHVEVTRSGDEMPRMDDHLSVTTLTQHEDRQWEPHPLMATLAKDAPNAEEKLKAIPVRIAYNDPCLNVDSSNSCYDYDRGRLLCRGDGQTARRMTDEGVQTVPCPGPDACSFGLRRGCKNMTRLYIKIDGQDDPLGVFLLRTQGMNSLQGLAGRIGMWHGATGGKIAGMPLLLQLKTRTTPASNFEPIYYVDLVMRPNMTMKQTIDAAAAYQQEMENAGFKVEGMETALREGLANSAFAEQLEDPTEWSGGVDAAERAEVAVARALSVSQDLATPTLNAALGKIVDAVRGTDPALIAGGDMAVLASSAPAEIASVESMVPADDVDGEEPEPQASLTLDLPDPEPVSHPAAAFAPETAPTSQQAQVPAPMVAAPVQVAGDSILLPWTDDDVLAYSTP